MKKQSSELLYYLAQVNQIIGNIDSFNKYIKLAESLNPKIKDQISEWEVNFRVANGK